MPFLSFGRSQRFPFSAQVSFAATSSSLTDAQRSAVRDAVHLAELWLDPATTFPAGATEVVAWSASEWVTASLRAFNDPDQSALTLPYLALALDSLPWIQRNRRIFFLGSWLGAFIGGQRDAAALRIIDDYLAAHPTPIDLRQKVLQSRDDLERTVRIRRAHGGT